MKDEYLEHNECILHFETVRERRQVSPVERIIYTVNHSFSTDTDGGVFVEKSAQAQVLSDAARVR